MIKYEKFRNGTEKIFEDYFLEFENDKLISTEKKVASER